MGYTYMNWDQKQERTQWNTTTIWLPYIVFCALLSYCCLYPPALPAHHIHYVCLFVPYSAQLANHSNIQPPIHLHLLLFVPIIIFPFHVSLLLSTQRGIHLFPVSPAFSHPYNIKHEIFYSSHVLPFNTASTLHNIPIRKPVLFPISCRQYVTGYTEIYTGWENNLVYSIQNVTIFSSFWPCI